jgi:ribosomal protein S12 methylthiotransferase accessory factor
VNVAVSFPGGVGKVALTLPPGFPKKYAEAIRRAVDQCAVKKHMVEPPAFELMVN